MQICPSFLYQQSSLSLVLSAEWNRASYVKIEF